MEPHNPGLVVLVILGTLGAFGAPVGGALYWLHGKRSRPPSLPYEALLAAIGGLFVACVATFFAIYLPIEAEEWFAVLPIAVPLPVAIGGTGFGVTTLVLLALRIHRLRREEVDDPVPRARTGRRFKE